MKTIVQEGPGWVVYQDGGLAWIKFNHRPDDKTLARLRLLARWDSGARAWQAFLSQLDELQAVVDKAMTWETVGEEAPSWLDDADYSTFHG